MQRNAEFSVRPEPFEITRRDGLALIQLRDNIHAGENDDGEMIYLADVYDMTMDDSDTLESRLTSRFGSFLTKAKADEAAREAAAELAKNRMTETDLAGVLADQEYRICLLEMGVSVDDL